MTDPSVRSGRLSWLPLARCSRGRDTPPPRRDPSRSGRRHGGRHLQCRQETDRAPAPAMERVPAARRSCVCSGAALVWTGSEKRTALIEFQEGRDGETSARGLGGIACAAACAVLGARRPRLGCWAGTDSRQRIAGAGPAPLSRRSGYRAERAAGHGAECEHQHGPGAGRLLALEKLLSMLLKR